MKERDKLYKEATSDNKPEKWLKYRNSRNEIVKIIKNEKNNYEMDKMSTNTNDPKAQWNMAKNILKWSKVKVPNKLLINNEVTNDNDEIKQTMNE